MRSQIWFAAVAILTFGTSFGQAQPKPLEPTVVVRLKSFDGLLKDVKYLATLAGREDQANQIDGILQAVAGPKGLAGTGIDTARPFGFYAMVGAAGVDSKGVLMVPVADEQALVEMANTSLAAAQIKLKKGDDGVYGVEIPNVPPGLGVAVRFANGYAYIGGPDRSAVDPANLFRPSQEWLRGNDAEVAAVNVRLDRIPDMLKQIGLQQLDVHAANAKERAQPNETAAQARLRAKMIDFVFQRVRSVLTDAAALNVNFTIDRQAGDITAQAALTAKPGSALAKEIANGAGRPSSFASVQADAARAVLSVALPDTLRDAFVPVIDEGITAAVNKETDAAKKEAVRKALTALAPTLKAGVIDVVVGMTGPNSAGHYAVFAGLKVEDGKGIERTAKEILAGVPERERQAVRLDAESIAGTAVHRLEPGQNIDARARRYFGDAARVLVAFRPDAALIVVGDASATDAMKALVEARATGTASMVDAFASFARIVPLGDKQGAAAEKVAAAVFGANPKGTDVARLTVRGGDALTIRISLKSDLIKFGTKLNERSE